MGEQRVHRDHGLDGLAQLERHLLSERQPLEGRAPGRRRRREELDRDAGRRPQGPRQAGHLGRRGGQSTLNSLADDLQKDVDEISSAVNGSGNTLIMISTVSTTLVTMGNQLSATFTKLQGLDAKGE